MPTREVVRQGRTARVNIVGVGWGIRALVRRSGGGEG